MKLQSLFCFVVLVTLSGCGFGGRYVRWGKDVFYQTKNCDNFRWLQDRYIRTLRIYDQLTTLALFDILWLSPEVRCNYNKEQLCEEEMFENNHEIAFYLLAAMPHSNESLLTDITSPWTMYLDIDGVLYCPTVIKLVDIPYPYQVFFGKHYSAFKQAYYVTFSTEKENRPLITEMTRSFALCFHTTGKADECVCWDVTPAGNALAVTKFNPDILASDMYREGGQV